MIERIFLDFDGVTHSSLEFDREKQFNAGCISCLNDLLNSKPDSKIVIITGWRLSHPFPELSKFLIDAGIPPERIECALPVIKLLNEDNEINKSYEITVYLEKNRVDRFVILDDNCGDLMHPYEKYCVEVDSYKGLTKEDVERAIEILNGEL